MPQIVDGRSDGYTQALQGADAGKNGDNGKADTREIREEEDAQLVGDGRAVNPAMGNRRSTLLRQIWLRCDWV